MALAQSFLSEDQFSCSICLEVFTNPVSTPCGHSFCQSCIAFYWDSQGAAKVYQCPLCKESFRKRPELHVNLTLKEITEHFKRLSSADRSGEDKHSHPQIPYSAPSSQPLAPRPGEMPPVVFDEMLTRFKRMQPPGSQAAAPNPNDVLPHKPSVTDRGSSTGHNTPPHPPPPYSSNSSLSADTEEHQGHNVLQAKREWLIKKSQVEIEDLKLNDLICVREGKAKEIKNFLHQIQIAAKRETEEVVGVFSSLISAAERCQAEVSEVIEMNRQTAEHKAQSLLNELEKEITELQRRSAALRQLAVSEDHLLFLKAFPVLSTPSQTTDWSDVSVSSGLFSAGISQAVNQIAERCQEEMRTLPDVCLGLFMDHSVPRPPPKVESVQDYAEDITLDPRTAHPRLVISVDGKQVHCGDRHQLVPDVPERFDRVVCVLARQGFSSGRHYWEVEVGGKTDWDLGIASCSVNRKGKITVSPAHGYWFLSLRDQTDYAFRTDPSTSLTVSPRPSRIGIFVDYDSGLVSFYNADSRLLIFTFTERFPDTVHPFFSPCTNKSGQNKAPLILCPVTM